MVDNSMMASATTSSEADAGIGCVRSSGWTSVTATTAMRNNWAGLAGPRWRGSLLDAPVFSEEDLDSAAGGNKKI